MFEKKQDSYTDQLGRTNRIVEGTTIEGNIISKADLRLDGHLIGDIQIEGKLVIGPAGKVIGDITCLNADIEGHFKGNIQVAQLLSVKTNAVIEGEVITGKLAVEPGALFTATCAMKQENPET